MLGSTHAATVHVNHIEEINGLANDASLGTIELSSIEVTSLLDDNGEGCTLREAITSINSQSLQGGCVNLSSSIPNTISFAGSLNGNTIGLNGSELQIFSDRTVHIDASSLRDGVTIDANQMSRILSVGRSTLNIDNLTLTGGAGTRDGGALVTNSSSFVTINNSTITGNSTTQYGGGIYNQGSLTLNNSTVSDNSSSTYAGGIYNAGSLTLNNSTISENSSGIVSGGIHNDGSLTLNNSTVSGNFSNGAGGGIFNDAEYNDEMYMVYNHGSITLNNSTVSGNSSNLVGGGIYNEGSLTLKNSTLSGNSAASSGGGIHSVAGTLTLTNSIIANSLLRSEDCSVSGTKTVIDNTTIIEDNTCSAARTGDPGLLPLADNGGLTNTHALSERSIARDSGDVTTCTSAGQRGFLRNNGDAKCDVGAVEFQSSDVPVSFYVISLPNGKNVVIPL
jgi:hypothetical protein